MCLDAFGWVRMRLETIGGLWKVSDLLKIFETFEMFLAGLGVLSGVLDFSLSFLTFLNVLDDSSYLLFRVIYSVPPLAKTNDSPNVNQTNFTIASDRWAS